MSGSLGPMLLLAGVRLGVRHVAAEDLDGGVLLLPPDQPGVIVYLAPGLELAGLCCVDFDGSDITGASGGCVVFLACETAAGATLAHEKNGVDDGVTMVMTASEADVSIGREPTMAIYKAAEQRWHVPL